jgi:hypothetical protein
MSGKSTTTVENKPWGPEEQAYKDLYASATSAFNSVDKNPYGGEYFAAPNADQQAGLASLKDAAGNMGGGQELQDLAKSQINGDFLKMTPELSGMIKAALDPITRKYSEVLLPGARDAAISGGAYGGARQDLQENQILQDYGNEASNTTANIAFQNYANERGIQQNSGNLLNQAHSLMEDPGKTLFSVGDTEQGWDQQQLAAEYQKWADAQSAPFNGMDKYAAILGSGGFGTQTQTKSSNPIAEVLQGLAGGLGLIGSFGNPFTAIAGLGSKAILGAPQGNPLVNPSGIY